MTTFGSICIVVLYCCVCRMSMTTYLASLWSCNICWGWCAEILYCTLCGWWLRSVQEWSYICDDTCNMILQGTWCSCSMSYGRCAWVLDISTWSCTVSLLTWTRFTRSYLYIGVLQCMAFFIIRLSYYNVVCNMASKMCMCAILMYICTCFRRCFTASSGLSTYKVFELLAWCVWGNVSDVCKNSIMNHDLWTTM